MHSLENRTYIYPTDTVWGIGASIYDSKGVLTVNSIKKCPLDKPQSIMFQNLSEASDYLDLPTGILSKIEKTYDLEISYLVSVERLRKEIVPEVFAGSDLVSFRINCLDYMDDLFKTASSPVTSTSLNLSGEPPIFREDEALDFWKKLSPDSSFFPNKRAISGNSSTMVVLGDTPSILREGKNVKEIRDFFKL